jgi:hypothetical protein
MSSNLGGHRLRGRGNRFSENAEICYSVFERSVARFASRKRVKIKGWSLGSDSIRIDKALVFCELFGDGPDLDADACGAARSQAALGCAGDKRIAGLSRHDGKAARAVRRATAINASKSGHGFRRLPG